MTAAQLAAAINKHGSIAAAARALGVSRPLLHYYIAKHGISIAHEHAHVTTARLPKENRHDG